MRNLGQRREHWNGIKRFECCTNHFEDESVFLALLIVKDSDAQFSLQVVEKFYLIRF